LTGALTIPGSMKVDYKGFGSIIYVVPSPGKLQKIILKHTDENYLFKDDDTHFFIVSNNSVAIKLKMNTLENKFFADQFSLSLKNPGYI